MRCPGQEHGIVFHQVPHTSMFCASGTTLYLGKLERFETGILVFDIDISANPMRLKIFKEGFFLKYSIIFFQFSPPWFAYILMIDLVRKTLNTGALLGGLTFIAVSV